MKNRILLLTLILAIGLCSASAQAQKEIKVETTVSDVTVFIKGAQVTRKKSVSLPAGNSTLRFTQLSPYIDAKSVQVKADGEVMILSVNHMLNYNDTIKNNVTAEALIKQIEAIDVKIEAEKTNLTIIAENSDFLKGNKNIGGTEKGIEYNNLKLTTEYYNQQITALTLKKSETDTKLKRLNEERTLLNKQLATLGSIAAEPTGEVVVSINCKTVTKAPLELSYYVNNAGWFPSYDIRAKDISQPIELIYKANVMQNTKEEWKNVKLRISSVNPNLGSVAPKLKTYSLNYWTKPPSYNLNTNNLSNTVEGIVTDEQGMPIVGASIVILGTTIGTVTDASGRYSLSIPANGGRLEASFIASETKVVDIDSGIINFQLDSSSVELEEVMTIGYSSRGYGSRSSSSYKAKPTPTPKAKPARPTLPVTQIENATAVEFEIKIPYSIASEGKSTVVEMEHYALPAEYEYYCVPKIDKDVFLLANISDWAQYNLLEGEANIFFENTFVGKTILDVRYLSDTLNISLGRDKNVIVKREKVKEFTLTKFLSSKAEVTRDWKITVRNNKRQPITLVLFDQIPVPTLSEIEVTPEKLSNGTLNKDSGEIKWKIALTPSQSTELELLYKVRYPKEKTLMVE